MPDVRYFPAIRRLADYEIWCNAKAMEVAGGLTTSQLFHSFPFGFKTIHATLFHIVEVFQTWSGCVGPVIFKPAMAPYDPNISVKQMSQWNQVISDKFLQSIDASHAGDLLDRNRRIIQVFHLVTHGTHHRTQFITMLRLLGKEPPYEAGDFGGWSNAT